VVPPAGTTVTSIPILLDDTMAKWACERPHEPGGAFVCDLDSGGWWPEPDGTTTVKFHIRIDRRVPGAKGTVRAYNPYDRTPANDTAAIPLEASPAPLYRLLLRPAKWAAFAGAVVAVVVVVYRRRRRAAS
jgi:hypothetical protein